MNEDQSFTLASAMLKIDVVCDVNSQCLNDIVR